MSIALIIATAIAASPWQYQVKTDLLGQSIHVAEAAGGEERPLALLKFSCGSMGGAVLHFNLGQVDETPGTAPDGDPAWEDVRFVFDDATIPAMTRASAISEGAGTFEVIGSPAVEIARRLAASPGVTIEHRLETLRILNSGSTGPINDVIDACPIKYSGQ
jgi:hypothetical protein